MKVGNWIKDLGPSCRDMTRLQSRALDDSLPLSKRVGMKIHLLFCIWCRRYGRQLRFLRGTLHDGEEKWLEISPHRLPDEARERIKEKMRS